MDSIHRNPLREARRVVVKVGTAVVTGTDGRLALGRIGELVEELHRLRDEGREVVLVTSGAVGLGAARLGWEEVPRGVVDRQACAAVGQGALMSLYDTLFRQLGETGAQVLLTEEDFLERSRYVNLHATLERLLGLGVTPVVNENDTVSRAEVALRADRVFGDNDRLSALVAVGIDADLLILVTDVDGVYTAPPGRPGARRVRTFTEDTQVVIGEGSVRGRGGMQAKIDAARIARLGGVPVVVVGGPPSEAIRGVVDGESVGTLFPASRSLRRRRHWLAFATSPEGRLWVNVGARRALVSRRASLLGAGVFEVEGHFEKGAVVSLVDERGREFGRGVVSRSAREVRDALEPSVERGRTRALVHRDNVVILIEVEGE